jgi:hypothetical protein
MTAAPLARRSREHRRPTLRRLQGPSIRNGDRP